MRFFIGLRNGLLISAILGALIGLCFAQEIDYEELRPAIAKIKVDTVRILNFTKTAEITLRYVDADGNYIKETKVIFKNQEDNPETPEDETSTEYTDLMQGLEINKTFLKNAIKAKLQIE